MIYKCCKCLSSKILTIFVCFPSNTARRESYFEQQFIVSSKLDCKLGATILTRISQRDILTWIQQATGKVTINSS